jgi:hypothetical protein
MPIAAAKLNGAVPRAQAVLSDPGTIVRLPLAAGFDPLQSPFFLRLEAVLGADPQARLALASFNREKEKISGSPTAVLESFFSTLYRDERLRALTNFVVRRFCLEQSERLWECLRNGATRTPEVVIGCGPNAVNYLLSRAQKSRTSMPLLIDRRGSGGGQFSITDLPVWKLNSRNGEDITDEMAALIPGRGRNLNSLGQYAYLQASSVSSQLYPAQDVLAFTARINLALLGSPALLYTDAAPRIPRAPATGAITEVPIDLTNLLTGERAVLTSGRLIGMPGLGKTKVEEISFLRDGKPVPIEQVPIDVPGGRIYTLEGFYSLQGTPELKALLRTTDQFAVGGAKDSGNVVCETILGQGPESSDSAVSRTGITVRWWGQGQPTRAAFEKCARPRYKLLGLEFPRTGGDGPGSNRILPDSRKIATVDQRDDGLQIIPENKGRSRAGAKPAQLLVLANGLKNPLLDPKGPFRGAIDELGVFPQAKLPPFTSMFPKALRRAYGRGDVIELSVGDKLCWRITVGSIETRIERNPLRFLLRRRFLKRRSGRSDREPSGFSILFRDRDPVERRSEATIYVENVRAKTSSQKKIRLGSGRRNGDGDASRSIPGSLPFGSFTDQVRRGLTGKMGKDGAALTLRVRRSGEASLKEVYETPRRSPLEGMKLVSVTIEGEKRAAARQLGGLPVYFAGPAALIPPSETERKLPALKISENVVALWFHASRISQLGQELDEPELLDPSLILRPDGIFARPSEPAKLPRDGRVRSPEEASSPRSLADLDPVGYLRARVAMALASTFPDPACRQGATVALTMNRGRVLASGIEGGAAAIAPLLSEPEVVKALGAVAAAEGRRTALTVVIPAVKPSAGANGLASWLRQLRVEMRPLERRASSRAGA